MEVQSFAVTVIVVTHNRPVLLRRALQTMMDAVGRVDFNVDVKVLVNGEDPASLEICNQFKNHSSQLPFEVRELNKSVTPAEGRNMLVDNKASDWLFFMDDDIQVPENLFKSFQNLCSLHAEVEAWGGPNLTPQDSETDAHRNGWFVENFFIVGPVSARYKKKQQLVSSKQIPGGQFNLMLCNLFVKTPLFIEEKFSCHLKTAEENDLIYRIKKRKKPIGYSDELFVWHERRPSLKAFFKQIFYYGFGRGQLLVSGNFFPQWHFALFPFLFLGLIIVAYLKPSETLIALGIWLAIVQFTFLKKFRKADFRIFFVPLFVWTLYTGGLIKGCYQGLRGAKNP